MRRQRSKERIAILETIGLLGTALALAPKKSEPDMVRHAVYSRKSAVPRRPAYAIKERVSTPWGNGRVDTASVAHCGPNGGYMWIYDLWMYNERVPKTRRAVWEEDVRPLSPQPQ